MIKNRKIAILFFTMIVVMMGFGLVIPIMPFYVESLGASGWGMGMLMAVFSVAQFLFAPIWGTLSDRYGRKSILIIGVFGNALSLLLMGLSTQLWMLIGSRALAGILSSATLPTAMAYVADSTSDEDRGGGMGVIGAAMGMGMVLGPGVGGWLATRSLSTPFYFAAGLSIVALLLVQLFLPESLPPQARARDKQVNGPQLNQMWQALLGPLGFLFVLAMLVSFALTNFEAVFGLYASHRYEYGPGQVGTILTVIGLISAVIQGALTGPATRRYGEVFVIKASLVASAAGFLLMLLAGGFAAVLLTTGFFIFGNAMIRPAISALISKRSAGGQGIAMGLNNAFMSLGRIIGPLWAGALFDIRISYPYLSAAVVLLLVFGMSLVWLRAEPKSLEKQAMPVGD